MTHCYPKSPTRRHRVPKWSSEARLWKLQGTLFLENSRWWDPHRTMLFTMFECYLAGCGRSSLLLERDKQPSQAQCQPFSLFVASGVEKHSRWGIHGPPKTLKSVQSDAQGYPKFIQNETLRHWRVPRVFPEVSGVPPLRKKTSK